MGGSASEGNIELLDPGYSTDNGKGLIPVQKIPALLNVHFQEATIGLGVNSALRQPIRVQAHSKLSHGIAEKLAGLTIP